MSINSSSPYKESKKLTWEETFTPRSNESNGAHHERIKSFVKEKLPNGAQVLISVAHKNNQYCVLIKSANWYDYSTALIKQFVEAACFFPTRIPEKYFLEKKLHEAVDEMLSHGAKHIEFAVWDDGNKALKITGANGTDLTNYVAKFSVAAFASLLGGGVLQKYLEGSFTGACTCGL